MSGKSQPKVIEPPAPPAIPSPLQQSKEYYNEILPLQMQAESQYGPQMAEQDYQMFLKYAPQYSQAMADIDKSLYPETYGLQENLARQAREGMTTPIPGELREQYRSDFNAGLGMNVNAPIGVSDRNVALMQLEKQWGDYYRDLGLSVASRQPLQQAAQPQFRDPSGGMQGYYGAAGNYAGNVMQGYNSSLANRVFTTGGQGGFSPTGALAGAAVGAPIPFVGPAGGALIGGFFGGR